MNECPNCGWRKEASDRKPRVRQPVTMATIGLALGISTMTVSRSIRNMANVSPKTRELVLKEAERVGYRVVKVEIGFKSGS